MRTPLTDEQKRILEEFEKEEVEARRIRESAADWTFINRQPTPIKEALTLYVKTGDLHLAAKIARMTVDEFNEWRKKARIPVVL